MDLRNPASLQKVRRIHHAGDRQPPFDARRARYFNTSLLEVAHEVVELYTDPAVQKEKGSLDNVANALRPIHHRSPDKPLGHDLSVAPRTFYVRDRSHAISQLRLGL